MLDVVRVGGVAVLGGCGELLRGGRGEREGGEEALSHAFAVAGSAEVDRAGGGGAKAEIPAIVMDNVAYCDLGGYKAVTLGGRRGKRAGGAAARYVEREGCIASHARWGIDHRIDGTALNGRLLCHGTLRIVGVWVVFGVPEVWVVAVGAHLLPAVGLAGEFHPSVAHVHRVTANAGGVTAVAEGGAMGEDCGTAHTRVGVGGGVGCGHAGCQNQ